MHSGHTALLLPGAACGGLSLLKLLLGLPQGILCPPAPVPAEPRVKELPRGQRTWPVLIFSESILKHYVFWFCKVSLTGSYHIYSSVHGVFHPLFCF